MNGTNAQLQLKLSVNDIKEAVCAYVRQTFGYRPEEVKFERDIDGFLSAAIVTLEDT